MFFKKGCVYVYWDGYDADSVMICFDGQVLESNVKGWLLCLCYQKNALIVREKKTKKAGGLVRFLEI